MTLDQIDDAVRLRNYRKNVIGLAAAARSGFMQLSFSGFQHPDSHISLQCVRNAVVAECEREIAKYEAELQGMGVEIIRGMDIDLAPLSAGEPSTAKYDDPPHENKHGY